MLPARHRISLLFNANKMYDRQIIEGIGLYLQSTRADWDVYLEEDFLARLEFIDDWGGDGIIADFDDPVIQASLSAKQFPTVGVGGSYADESEYPDVSYVATDNHAVVQAAYEHLKHKGLERFAFYGVPPDNHHRWAVERENAMKLLCKQDDFSCSVYRGFPTNPSTWRQAMERLIDWIKGLPNPIGIVAVTDARARHILQACEHIGKIIPDNIALIGIDDDDIARNLSRISLSSVTQGGVEMGYQSAKLLHKKLENPSLKNKRVLIPPVGVSDRQSTDFKALEDAFVIQAMHFIRQNACRGIKVDQVLDYVGVSRTNLEQRFKEERGHSIHTELHNEKLYSACKMLERCDLSMSDVATVCGYPSLQYMYAVFKKHFGQTPKQFRDKLND